MLSTRYLSGEYVCKLDAKGRMMIPARIKTALPKSPDQEDADLHITLRRGFEPCLTLYSQTEWARIFQRIVALDEFNQEQRNFQRSFLRGCTEIELDKTGRFLIPKTMLRYAGLEKEAILVGMGNRMEIWNPERYEEFLIQDEETFSALAEKYLSDRKETEPNPGVVVNISKAEIKENPEASSPQTDQTEVGS